MSVAQVELAELFRHKLIGCANPVAFIEVERREFLSKEAFAMLYTPLCNRAAEETHDEKVIKRFRDNPVKWAVQSSGLRRVRGTCYEPGGPDFNADGFFNMYLDSKIEPLEEVPEFFLDHMNYLIPDDRERELFLKSCAWLFQHPMKKLGFGVLLVGDKGTGKSWIGRMFQGLMGRENALKVSEQEAITAKFNALLKYRRLIWVDEVRPDDKTNLVNALAYVISEPDIKIEPKGVDPFNVPNYTATMGASNFRDALGIDPDDRRCIHPGIKRAMRLRRESRRNSQLLTQCSFKVEDATKAFSPWPHFRYSLRFLRHLIKFRKSVLVLAHNLTNISIKQVS